jgi:hypothetical protein
MEKTRRICLEYLLEIIGGLLHAIFKFQIILAISFGNTIEN